MRQLCGLKENTASPVVACWTVFTELLPGNVLIISVTLFILNGLQAYHHFFSETMLAMSLLGFTFLPWLSFHCVYSPTASAAHSLRPLIQSGFLIGCQLIQVYHYHPAFLISGGKSSENGKCSYIYGS
jgi:hypothetical protein